MHSNNSLKECLCLILLCLTGVLTAQTDFRSGYVINLQNDTLIGDIDYRGDVLMGEGCLFKPKNKDKSVKYAPDEIAGYRFKDDKYFVSKQVAGKKVFLEFLIKGKINIYYLRNNEGDHYFIEKEGEKLTELPYSEGTVIRDKVEYFNKTSTHIGILIYYMKDAPKFLPRINEMAKPDHNSLIQIAKDYHNAVCTSESCIIYKKKIPTISANLEVLGGFLDYNNTINNGNNYFHSGILAHIWLPRSNEKLYFRTGVLYSTVIGLNNLKVAVYKIPLQIEYMYSKYRVKPKLAYGINLYKPLYLTVGFMGGVNIQLNKKIDIALNYDVDFEPITAIPLLPKNFLSQSILGGVYIKL